MNHGTDDRLETSNLGSDLSDKHKTQTSLISKDRDLNTNVKMSGDLMNYVQGLSTNMIENMGFCSKTFKKKIRHTLIRCFNLPCQTANLKNSHIHIQLFFQNNGCCMPIFFLHILKLVMTSEDNFKGRETVDVCIFTCSLFQLISLFIEHI